MKKGVLGLFTGIKGKIILGFALVFVVVLVGFGYIMVALGNSEDTLKNMYSQKNATVEKLEETISFVQTGKELSAHWLVTSMADDPKKLELKKMLNTKAEGSQAQRISDYFLKDTKTWVKQHKDTMDNIMEDFGALLAKQAEITDMWASVDDYNDIMKELEKEGYQNEILALSEGIIKACERLATIKTTEKAQAEVIASFDAINIGIIIVVAFVIAVAVFSTYLTTRQIVRPINEANQVIKAVANGDLTAEVQMDRNDEVGQMMKHMGEMVGKLKSVITFIVQVSENIARASGQVKSSSGAMSDGATQQAASAEEVASSMEEMSANIQQNTDNAQQTEKIALKAAEEVQQGSEVVNETVSSMDTIAKKISIIGEIARQTNLLALNAAVEAARAGEHGRGFAVVAAEVRKLAERSHEAAQDIDQLTESSLKIAGESGEMLNQVVPNINHTAQLVQEIAAASMEQSSGADQVNNAIQHLNQIVQQNAASSEEMAASAEELNAQATELHKIVAYFKIDQNSASAPTSTNGSASTENISDFEVPHVSAPDRVIEEPITASSAGFELDLDAEDSLDQEYEKF